jgi:cell wall-associated NlpC family hydrolase
MNLRVARLAATVSVVVAAVALAPLAAGGSPIDDKKAEAAHLQAEIDANGAKIDALSEQYNGAQYKLSQLDGQIASSRARLQAAQNQFSHIQSQVNTRAAEIYMGAGSDDPLSAIDVQNLNDLAARSKYAAAASSRDADLMNSLLNAKEQLQTQRKQLEHDRADAQAQKDRIAKARDQLQTLNAQENALLDKTNRDVAALVKKAKAEAAAAAERARAAAASERSVSNGGGGGGSDSPSMPVGAIPPTSPRAMIAVQFALAQVGKPYKYATSGPDTYDCSGLTAASWEHAGVSMPHYSGAQYEMFPHVPLSAIQPGDLLFRGPGGSQHVEIYIGGGEVVTAPHTGDFVKVAPMGNVLPMAARPG